MEPLNILVVGGHPKDILNHCGCTLARHAQRGDKVTGVVMTHGLRIHDILISEELRFQKESPDPERLEALMQKQGKVKNAEVIEAAEILGMKDVRFLSHDDSVLLVTEELIQAIAKIIREVKPHIVITHYPLEEGGVASHHGNAGKITLYAIQAAGNLWPGDPNPGYRVAQVFFMAPEEATFRGSVLAGTPPTFCDYYVDVTDLIHLKVKALNKLESMQLTSIGVRKGCEAWNGKDGFWMTVGYAEGFIRHWPEIGDYLPVSKERLERANEPEADAYARRDKLTASFLELPED